MINNLLEASRQLIYDFEQEHPGLATNCQAFLRFKQTFEVLTENEPVEFQWLMKVHYNKPRYIPYNPAAQEFMKSFMKNRSVMKGDELGKLREVFNIRNVVIPPENDKDLYSKSEKMNLKEKRGKL